jgi:hypothetical protein
MTDLTDIIVPPYHVQSTALELRNGFPYFAHHESVSSLWAQKWRSPCQHGIYPFSDGNVVDFDPIFQELIKLSGDSSDILFRPDDYASAFFPAAEQLVKSAAKAEEEGETAKARDLYLRAAAVYRTARFPNQSLKTDAVGMGTRQSGVSQGRTVSQPGEYRGRDRLHSCRRVCGLSEHPDSGIPSRSKRRDARDWLAHTSVHLWSPCVQDG